MSDSFTTSELITATQQVFKFNPLFLKLFFRETYTFTSEEVFLDKIPHIDAALPRPGRKPFPCLAHFLYLLFAHTPRRRGPFSFLYRPGGGH